MSIKSTLTLLGLGAGLMYFYDPRSGARRRSQVRDQVVSAKNNAGEFMDAAVEDLRNRARGIRSIPNTGKATVSGMRDAVSETAGNLTTNLRSSLSDTQGNLTPGIRLLAAVGGGLLTLYGRGRGGLIGSALSVAGLGLAARGVTNIDYRRLLGLGDVKDAIGINKTINIDASPEEVYQFWQNFENFPKFMSNIKEIHRLEDNRSHWVVKGPAGSTMEWDAITTESVANERISWESTGDSPVRSTGTVRFDPNNKGGTRLTVMMSYTPPAGAVGHAVATLFSKNPRQEMNDDLARLKSLLETGKTRSEGKRVNRQDLAGAAGTVGTD